MKVLNVAPALMLNGDTDVNEGSTHTYSFTVVDPGQDSFDRSAGYPTCDTTGTDGRLVEESYSATAAGGSFKCSFPDGPATADVKMKVADSDGASVTDSESVTVVSVANVAPVVTAAADQTAEEGASASFDLGSVADPGADTWTLDVDWGDGSAHGTGAPAQTGTLGSKSHAFADDGTYTVTVKVTDKDGEAGRGTFEVVVDNVAPSVSAPGDHTADEGAAKDFGLGSFSDPGANDADWTVDVNWGDGSEPAHLTKSSAGSLGLANHAYDDNGLYTVTLKVSDKDGASDTKTYKVTVANVAPTATLGNNGPIAEGGSALVSFTAAADVSAKDAAAGFKYAIVCDGPFPAATDAGPASSKTCSFAQDGTKTVKGIVVDKDGGSREYSTSVAVSNANPVLTGVADQTAFEGAAKAFDLGSFTDAGADDNPWSVQVNWGDASAADSVSRTVTGAIPATSHAYKDNGVYTATVTVTDKDGGKGTETFKVTVDNVAPKITSFTGTDYLTGPNAFLDGNTGTGVRSTLTTTFTDPGADTWTGLFNYSDGSPLTETVGGFTSGSTRTHAFSSSGCKSASVKVTDDDGGSDTASTTVKVGTGTFQPPMTNQPVTDKLRNGQVLPVKVRITDCAGAPVTTLAPAIRLVKGDLTPQSDDTTAAITPTSSSAADTSGVMRSQGGGDYIYNMQVSLPSLNTDYTVVIYPYGTGSHMELGHVVQATK